MSSSLSGQQQQQQQQQNQRGDHDVETHNAHNHHQEQQNHHNHHHHHQQQQQQDQHQQQQQQHRQQNNADQLQENNRNQSTRRVSSSPKANNSDNGVGLYSWGQNAYGELGLGDIGEWDRPQRVNYVVENGLTIVKTVAGNEHTAILTDEGQVYCCGYNDSGQCGVGHTNRVRELQPVLGLEGKKVSQLYSANGCEHILAVTEEGLLYAWGYNARGQLGHNLTSHTTTPSLVEPMARKRVVQVACSYYHTVLSTSEDEIYAMGRNDYGQLGVGDTNDRQTPTLLTSAPHGMILSLACGQYHTIISVDGRGLFGCGKNDYGQLGISLNSSEPRTTPVSVSAPLDGSSDSTISEIACGYYHTVALLSCGQVYAWGRNDYGQLGIGNMENKRRPQLVDIAVNNIIQISCGCYHTLLLTDDGQVFVQGRNNHGQLGTNSKNDTMVPVKIEALANKRVTLIAAGFYHSVCLTEGKDDMGGENDSTLSFDLRNMLDNPARADVVFIVEDKRIYAHRCIIMARCSPLERMLDGPMREGTEKEIVLKDLQYHVVLALLEFLYTDRVEALDPQNVDLDFALDLLAAADQFLIERLKHLCEIAIQKSINVDNVAIMFRTADIRQASALRKRCFNYILRNFGKVIGTEGFVTLPVNLLREVLFAAHAKGVTIRP